MRVRFATIVVAAALAAGFGLSAQTPPATAPPPTVELADAFPAGANVDQFVLSADGQRTYFVTKSGEAWLFDRSHKTSARVATGPLWDLNLSPIGDALAYTKAGPTRGDEVVWVVALEASTGLARGAERQLSQHQGGVPSIAPDGKLVAFARDDASGAGQSVIVVPIAGGAERVVVPAIPSSLANIRWTPDGKTLYFGVNPPVACVPEWSCLPLKQELRQPNGKIRRVSVAGGDAADVASTRGATPGLSPDGTTLMFLDATAMGSTRRWVVANADGSRRSAFTLAPGQTVIGWVNGSTALVTSSGIARRMRALSLAGGPSKVLADDGELLAEPSWSPDGSLMMTVARTTPHAELHVQRPDGSGARTISLPEPYAIGAAWSPDQKRIAYVGLSDTEPSRVSTVDLASGRVDKLYELRTDESVVCRWLSDSRTLMLSETIGRPDTGRRVAFRKVDLGGVTSVLREIALGPLPSNGVAVDDTIAVVRPSAQDGYRAVRLNGDGPDREILPTPARDATAAALSADAKWLIFRHGPNPGESGSVIEFYRVDGSDHRTISVPFQIALNPKMIPGSTDVIAFESPRASGDSGVYLVSNTQPPRQLFTYSSQSGPPDVAISPDGRTLLFLLTETVPPSIRTMDVSARGK
jgi:Tol biopolymer transport system component